MKALNKLIILVLVLFTCNSLFAQEAEEKELPKTLVFSQNIIAMKDLSKLQALSDSVFSPIVSQMVDEGKLFGWGQLNHAWGDEWNFNLYYIAKDHKAFLDFWNEYIKRVSEEHPNAVSQWINLVQEHKDNIYSVRNMYSAMQPK